MNALRIFWLLWLLLWVALSLRTKPVARREPLASRAAHLVPIAIGALLMADRTGLRWLDAPIWPRPPWAAAAGGALVLAGLAFAIWARLTLAGNWSGTVTVKQGHELIRTGPYGMVRHPIYTGLVLALAGNLIAIDAWRAALALAIILAAFLRKIRTEEQMMRETFGAAYGEYAAAVPRLIPWVRF